MSNLYRKVDHDKVFHDLVIRNRAAMIEKDLDSKGDISLELALRDEVFYQQAEYIKAMHEENATLRARLAEFEERQK